MLEHPSETWGASGMHACSVVHQLVLCRTGNQHQKRFGITNALQLRMQLLLPLNARHVLLLALWA